jgi:hypothetical protein
MIFSQFGRWRVFKILMVLFLLAWYAFFLVTPVSFIGSDLGRHLKNGEIFVSSIGNPAQLKDLLHTNFYSSTFPNFPFINHHWGTGVIFYVIWSLVGFKGLSLFYIAVSIITFLIFFFLAVGKAGWKIASPIAFFLVPLIAERVEARPEGLSYLFAAIFFLLLTRYSQGRWRFRTLLIFLPLLEIIWINCHIYFVFGLVLIAFFGLERFFTQPDKLIQIKKFGTLFLLTAVAGLMNPSGLNGLLLPLRIFQNYGIDVTENNPGWLLVREGLQVDNYPVFIITLAFLVVGIVVIILRKCRGASLASLLFAVLLGYFAWTAVRNYTFFGLFAFPALAIIIFELKPSFSKWRPISRNILTVAVVFFVVGVTLWLNSFRVQEHYTKSFGIGIAPNSLDVAIFFTDNNLSGPIFNDFDIGSYIIYSFFPRAKPFIDGRAEAYPASWIRDTFIPMHISPDLWQRQEDKFHFNAIMFSLNDKSPWQLPFLVARINDPTWAPVFADKFVIIFLKRNLLNESVIKKFEIRKERFKCASCPYVLK